MAMMSGVTGVALPGARKAAVLTLLLGEEQSTAIFKFLREDEIEKITKEVAALGSVHPEFGEKVLEEFHLMSKAAGYVTRSGVEYAKSLLLKSLGPDTARRILDRVIRSFESTADASTDALISTPATCTAPKAPALPPKAGIAEGPPAFTRA